MFVILFSLTCCLVAFWIYVKLSSQMNELVPKIPKSLILLEIGLFKLNFNNLYKRMTYLGRYTNENGGVTRFNCGPFPVYVVSNAEDMVTVLNKCTKKIFVFNLIKPYVGSQLAAAEFPVWKRNRRLLDLAFKQNILDGYMDIFNAQASRLATAMAKEVNKETDFISLIGRNFLETTCLTALGIKMSGQEHIVDTYVKSVDKVIETTTCRFQKPWLMLDFLFKFSSLKKEQDEALKIVWNFSEEIIKKKKIELSQQSDKGHNSDDSKFQSILDIVMENRDENQLNDINLRQLMDNVILAAFDTNIHGLLFSLICIGSYPEVQRKVYEEVISVTGKTDKDILKEDLSKLVYLEAVIKEAIRLYPPGLVTARTSTSEVQLKDYILPDGCHVILHLAAVNRNKTYWGQDADEFRPERWFEALPDEFAAFASFAPGRRGCVGKKYALINLKMSVAKLIKMFHISGNNKNLDLEFVVFLKPIAGHLIKLELREQVSETKQ